MFVNALPVAVAIGMVSPNKPHDRVSTRRQFLALCGSATVGGCVAPGASAGTREGPRTATDTDSTGDGWHFKRYDAANTGCNPLASERDGSIENDWRSGVGNITSTPVIARGTLFTGGGRNVYAIDVATGKKRWQVKTSVVTGNFSPAVESETLYIVGRVEGTGQLLALATSDGSIEWQFDGSVTTSPIIADGTVFLGCENGDQALLQAVDAATGESVWAFPVGDGHSRVGDVPAVANGTAYCTVGVRLDAHEEGREGQLVAVDASTGRRSWKRATDAPVVSAPAVKDGTVYFGDNGGTVHAVDAATGDEEWISRPGSGIRTSPAVAADALYVKDEDGVCYALDPERGRTRWRATTDSSGIDLSAGGETVYVGGVSLYALDRTDGSVRWSQDVSAYSDSHYAPAVTASHVFHGICLKQSAGEHYDNYVYALE